MNKPMNKPIINGIDVSKCEFYDDLECDAYRQEYWEPQDNTKDFCNEHENCYFKQSKRLQQELDIKEKMLDKFMIGSGETLEKLQKENEELKKRQITKNGFICHCEQNAKYKQALEETLKILCNGRTFYEGYFDTPILSRTDKAIKVINEVLNES